ncbi:unnamed protein product [Chilo suppressalis]|uniref:Gelsolin n=1 Tax=Chilo suppressalis TaxID=168631 RepID=A0ABN8BCU8_CHISP|nr:unnamed protein product [Chilo suppressalis]
MEHPAFSDAGSSPGIEIWGIDKFEPMAVDAKMYGKFFNADSYIVLKTTGDNKTPYSYDAHFWLGGKTTQDKKGSAAILTVTLDDMLGGRAVHHREVQGHESSKFLGYFKPAIRYLDGGTESGFNQVEINAGAEKRLLKLSGCNNMRIEEVPAEASSLTKSHCFILEVDHDIFVLMPEGAKALQRRKIISVANDLRDDYHNGRATIEIIDEFSSDDDFSQFFEALGSGSKDELAEDDSTTTYARDSMTEVYLFRVIAGDELDLVSLSKPYKQGSLSSSEVYILDTPCSGVYIWIGKDVDDDTKKNYNDIVQKYLDSKGYPDWVQVTRVSDGIECSNFKQYFHNWDTVVAGSRSAVAESDAGYFSADAEESQAAAKQIGKSAAARGFMPDNGEGTLTVTRIAGDQEDLSESFQSGVAILYQTEAYVFKYQYSDANGEDAYILYYWIGAEASSEDKAAAKELVSEMEKELEGDVTVVKVPQGKESKHFLNTFKVVCTPGFMVSPTREGSNPSGGRCLCDLNEHLYSSHTKETVYVWNGKDSNTSEQEAALKFVETVVKDKKDIVTVDQGDEPDEFWEMLGGAPEESEEGTRSGWKAAVSRRVTTDCSLTAVSLSIAGKIGFEESGPDFTQQDLSDDGVYILDTGEELYFWLGKNTPERVKAARENILKEYIEDDGLDRTADNAVMVVVKQGKEPKVFRRLFPTWDVDMWDNQTSYEDIKNEAKASNPN